MKKVLPLFVICLLSAPALGQLAPKETTPKLDPTNSQLDAYLLRWEAEMKKIKTFAARCTRTEKNPVFETTDRFQGTIHFMKPSYVLLHMAKKGDDNVYDRFLCTPNFLYQYVPSSKEIHVYKTPNAKPGQQRDDNSLSFLFGLKAADAKRRYDLKLAKTDKYYVYVDIIPRSAVDKAEFQKARVVLNKATMLPRQLWFQQPNKEEVLWDFPQIKPGVDLRPAHFARPKLPQGWKWVPKRLPGAAGAARPKTIRNQNR